MEGDRLQILPADFLFVKLFNFLLTTLPFSTRLKIAVQSHFKFITVLSFFPAYLYQMR